MTSAANLIHVAELTHSQVVSGQPEIVQREIELEAEAVDTARETIRSRIDKAGVLEGSKAVRRELRCYIEDISEAIDDWIEAQNKPGPSSSALPYLKLVTSEQAAYIVARECFSRAVKQSVGFTSVCVAVGAALRSAVEAALFAEANPDAERDVERLQRYAKTGRQKAKVLRDAMDAATFEEIDWEVDKLTAAGHTLVMVLCDATQLFEKVMEVSKTKKVGRLRPTDALRELIQTSEDMDVLLTPYHLPMLIPPMPWTSPYDGGYLDKTHHPLVMVKTQSKADLSMLEAADLTRTYAALNAIQATPWRINLDVMEVFEALAEKAEPSAGLAGKDMPALPEKPWKQMDKDEWEEWISDPANAQTHADWKAEAKTAHVAQAEWSSQYLIQRQQRYLADRLAQEPAIYFPHTLDFRGRIYPAAGVGAINPQGNDLGKALLQFSRAKPLGEAGAKWLAIHLANCWGNDKVSLMDRELWAHMNSDMLESIALDALVDARWMEADKPFQFLAACFEWLGYLTYGEQYRSRLPIALDGSCSGLQHFAGIMLDEKTARAVNVIQTGDTPEDVYMTVMHKVADLLDGDTSELAVEWSERLHRNVVKQPVMTTPYGVSPHGMVEQINDNARRLVKDGKIDAFSDSTFRAAAFLAPIVDDAIDIEVAAAGLAMDWLKEVATICAKAGYTLRWETPLGLPIHQSYKKTESRVVRVRWRGKRCSLSVGERSSRMDKKRQAAGIAPNFVHSMDACHLAMTVLACTDVGINDFAMIHDSFATHACDTDEMNRSIRSTFIELYSTDALRTFYDGLRSAVPEGVHNMLPEPPVRGSLDLTKVASSLYFFA